MFPSLYLHPSYLALKEHIDGASTTSRGRRFQFSTILCEKKPALSDVLHRGLYNFKLCPRVPHSPSDLTKYCLQSTSSLPVKILYTSSMSPRIRRCSSVCNPMTLSLSSYPVFLIPVTSLVALRWTFSKISMSLRKYGLHTWTQYSK